MISTLARTSQPDFLVKTEISLGARVLAEYLNRQTKRYGDVWFGNRHIAIALGVCVSTVVRWLKELRLKGLVAVIRDYALATRRRILLLWRQPSQKAVSAPMADNGSISVPAVAPVPAPVASEPPPPPPTPPPPATEAEVNRVVAKAEKLFGSPMRKRVITLAMETRLSWVEMACDMAVKRRDVTSWGWVIAVCRNWLLDPPPVKKSYFERGAEQLAILTRLFGVGS